LTGGDLRCVQRFRRHKDARLLQRYDDNRQDLGGRWPGAWLKMPDGLAA
jgi:hypothetical protein